MPQILHKARFAFLDQFERRMLCREKTMTCRYNPSYGDPGDTFEAFGSIFCVTKVTRKRLWQVAQDDWEKEGCSSPDEFIQIWIDIKGHFKAFEMVFAYEFVRLNWPRTSIRILKPKTLHKKTVKSRPVFLQKVDKCT